MDEPVPAPRRPRWARAAVVAFVAFELAAGAVLVSRDSHDVRPAARPPASARPTPARDSSADRHAALRTAAVTDLLDRRAAAIRGRDRAAFLATLDPTRTAFVTKQLAMYDALARVPLAAWRYDVDASGAVGNEAPQLRAYAAEEAWSPRATLRYEIRGFDDAPTAVEQYFTFVRRGDAWLVASDSDFDATTDRRTARDIWDFGPVSVVHGVRSLVLGHPGHSALLRDVASQTDAAIPRVTNVWGTGWSQKVVVVVPETQHELATILGDATDLSRIAAVAVAELPGDTGNHPVGNRVLVNPPNFRRLGANGRRVVVTHEVTHVATRDFSGAGAPTWLVEGFADYVGYLGTGLGPHAICQELAAEVRRGRIPAALPRDSEFGGGNARLAQAYEEAWLAMHLIADRTGRASLVAFYRAVSASDVPAAMRTVLHTTPETFTAAWRAYVKKTLG